MNLKSRSKIYVWFEWNLFIKPSIKFAYNRGMLLKLQLDSIQNYDRLIKLGYEVEHNRGAMYNVYYE